MIGDVFLFLCRGIAEAARGTSGAEEEVGERIPAFKRWEHHERVFVSESDTDRERDTHFTSLSGFLKTGRALQPNYLQEREFLFFFTPLNPGLCL